MLPSVQIMSNICKFIFLIKRIKEYIKRSTAKRWSNSFAKLTSSEIENG